MTNERPYWKWSRTDAKPEEVLEELVDTINMEPFKHLRFTDKEYVEMKLDAVVTLIKWALYYSISNDAIVKINEILDGADSDEDKLAKSLKIAQA
jgi:hypothetical protein